MTLKEFIEENQVTGFEKIEDLLINVVVNESSYGLDVDTSNIESGMILEIVVDFQIVEDILYIENFTYNTNDINLL
jgi:hypothetical protein